VKEWRGYYNKSHGEEDYYQLSKKKRCMKGMRAADL